MKKVLLISLVLVLGLAANALAVSLTFNYDGVFSGAATPGGTPPWLTAKFQEVDANNVQLTMSTAGLKNGEFVDGSGWYFNFLDTKVVTALVFSYISGNDADGIALGSNAFKADGDGYFDIMFSWAAPPPTRFAAGQTSVYNISYIGGLSVLDFKALSFPGGGWGPYESAVHVQGIGLGAEFSGWVYPSGGGQPGNGEVPEPGTIVLLGAGLLGLGLLGKRNFKK